MLGAVLSPQAQAQGQQVGQATGPHHLLLISPDPSQMALLFPEEGLVFDYRLEDGGISSTSDLRR